MSKAPKNYITWVFTDHYFNNGQGMLKFVATIFGFIMPFHVIPPVIQELTSFEH